jgi:cell wall-associated NlpC family hydrolase
MTTTIRRSRARALTLAGALIAANAAVFAISTSPAHRADAATTFGSKVVYTAATRKGDPYVRGAAGPTRFDCSGLTKWTFARLGHSLSHSAAAQYAEVKHIPRQYRRKGDLVFFHSGSGIYHVAIYVGNGYIWHAPYSGAHVRMERIWTSSVYYGRVG